MQARLPERFVRVKIANSGHEALVQQERFEARLAPAQLRCEDLLVELDQRIWAEALGQEIVELVAGAEEVDAAELAWIDESQLRVVVELDRQVRVRFGRVSRRLEDEVAAHLAMDRQPSIVVETDEQVFAAPADGHHASAAQ